MRWPNLIWVAMAPLFIGLFHDQVFLPVGSGLATWSPFALGCAKVSMVMLVGLAVIEFAAGAKDDG